MISQRDFKAALDQINKAFEKMTKELEWVKGELDKVQKPTKKSWLLDKNMV